MVVFINKLVATLKTLNMNENFVIEWLKQYFDKPKLDEKSLIPVLHFSLLWNLFEHTYFTDDRHLTPARLSNLSEISHSSISDECLNRVYIFFKNRYFPENQLDQRFTTLRLDTTVRNGQVLSNFEYCQNVLIDNNPSIVEKTKTIFLIIHRFRNNLFHGRKNPQTLNIYEQPFNEINLFLIHFIEKTAEDNAINNNRQIQ